MNEDIVKAIRAITLEAGVMAREFKAKGLIIHKKADGSVVTNADLIISDYIHTQIKKITPDIRQICEEREDKKLLSNEPFWLIDPIDGTRSYIKGKDSYSINIGYIENNLPKLGFIYQPALDILHYTDHCGNLVVEGVPKRARMLNEKLFNITIGCYDRETNHWLAKNKEIINEVIVYSSSVKFCFIADGEADVFPKFGPICEWDTAAGHAIVLASGGRVTTPSGDELSYGKPEFKNGIFAAYSNRWLKTHRIIE